VIKSEKGNVTAVLTGGRRAYIDEKRKPTFFGIVLLVCNG
jgi:hypothetical protein